MFPKNQQNRERGETPGEAGADAPFGAEPKPMLDERPSHRTGMRRTGMRGEDRQQDSLRDVRQGAYDEVIAGGNPQSDEPTQERTLHTDAQGGADVRRESRPVDGRNLPEGLRRQRAPAYDKHGGVDDGPTQLPDNGKQ